MFRTTLTAIALAIPLVSSASANPPVDPGDLPTFPAPSSFARGDQLDAWCKGKTMAINFAVCSDIELRGLAIERLRALNEARTRLSPHQQKVLLADQNGWALSYPQACGLRVAEPPALPLAPSIKECLADAGRKRLSYLSSYGLPGAMEPPGAMVANAHPTSSASPPGSPGAPTEGTSPGAGVNDKHICTLEELVAYGHPNCRFPTGYQPFDGPLVSITKYFP
jgi:hypothetical protein